MNWGLINCPSDSDTIIETLNQFQSYPEITICELGIGNGNTGNRMVDFLKSIKIEKIKYFGIDNKSLSILSKRDCKHQFEHEEMQFIHGDYNNIVPCDFILVDACHCADCVHRDAIAASKKVHPNGYMAFHDTSLLWQYPHNTKRNSWQHYESGEQIRPLNVVEGIMSSRCLWDGEWQLFLQTGDNLTWGGMRVYKKLVQT